jgi:hypothetical protein
MFVAWSLSARFEPETRGHFGSEKQLVFRVNYFLSPRRLFFLIRTKPAEMIMARVASRSIL